MHDVSACLLPPRTFETQALNVPDDFLMSLFPVKLLRFDIGSPARFADISNGPYAPAGRKGISRPINPEDRHVRICHLTGTFGVRRSDRLPRPYGGSSPEGLGILSVLQ